MTEGWNQTSNRPAQPAGKRRRWFRWFWIVLGCLVVIAAGIAYDLYRMWQPPAAHGSVKVTIAQGESVASLGAKLRADHLIRSAWLFRLYVRQTHAGPRIRAGRYSVPSGMTIPEILVQFEGGHTLDTSLHVTFPEGYTIEKMAKRLQTEHICSAADFLKAVKQTNYKEPFLQDVQEHKGTRYRLEGYLFPDTYDFSRGESAHKVVNEMLADFQRHIAPVLHETKGSKQSLTDLVTIASMVEAEVKVESERPEIASVIYNRMHRTPPMKLQIDATVEYAMGHHADVVTYHDLNVDSPYNTYRNPGLPPGPICNPGIESIDAALHPKHTSYLYYVAKNDGTGGHYFARTMAEQVRNEAKSQANLKK